MSSTLTVPLLLSVDVHEIEGGGLWGEVKQFPGCVAQAETLEELEKRIIQAVGDWWSLPGLKTEDAARELAAIQGGEAPAGPFPMRYEYQPPPSWTEVDEDE